MDKISKEKRTRNMFAIVSKNTKPEIAVRKGLYKLGLGFRIHSKLPGKPDIIFPSRKVAIFINGCFWHGHGCEFDHKPKTNVKFWLEKIKTNKIRDKKALKDLKSLGWKTLTVWECEIEKNLEKSVNKIEKLLRK